MIPDISDPEEQVKTGVQQEMPIKLNCNSGINKGPKTRWENLFAIRKALIYRNLLVEVV